MLCSWCSWCCGWLCPMSVMLKPGRLDAVVLHDRAFPSPGTGLRLSGLETHKEQPIPITHASWGIAPDSRHLAHTHTSTEACARTQAHTRHTFSYMCVHVPSFSRTCAHEHTLSVLRTHTHTPAGLPPRSTLLQLVDGIGLERAQQCPVGARSSPEEGQALSSVNPSGLLLLWKERSLTNQFGPH